MKRSLHKCNLTLSHIGHTRTNNGIFKFVDRPDQRIAKANYNYCEPGSDLPTGYIGLSLRPQDPRGLQQTVVRMESMAGIWSFRLNFAEILS